MVLTDASDALVVLRRKIDGVGSGGRTYEGLKRSFDTQDLRRVTSAFAIARAGPIASRSERAGPRGRHDGGRW
jgi:hypothetical protein